MRTVLLMFVLTSLCFASQTGNFTRSPHETMIYDLENPFTVRAIRGSVSLNAHTHEPLKNVLVEVQGPGKNLTIRKTVTNAEGKFELRAPVGHYRFKITLDGMKSIMGWIDVSPSADKTNQVQLEMEVGT
jgi:hypothetical protein